MQRSCQSSVAVSDHGVRGTESSRKPSASSIAVKYGLTIWFELPSF